MFNPSRDQARLFFVEAWRKYRARELLSELENVAVDIVLQHTEYHALLADPDAVQREFSPDDGQINPFLHLSLHLAIEEQLRIDQPAGLRDAFEAAQDRHHGERHEALHDLLECLGETIWQAQRNGQPLDAARYVACVRKRAGLAH